MLPKRGKWSFASAEAIRKTARPFVALVGETLPDRFPGSFPPKHVERQTNHFPRL